ncbi:MAG: Rho termination factor N-terminal domain-containing protein [Ilumatobacteraceae bacterium]
MTAMITTRLDEFEATLPAIPARVVRFQRAFAGAAYDRTAAVVTSVAGSTKAFLDTARISGKTVTGQARAAGDDVLTTTRTGAKTVLGQASAQGKKVSSKATAEVTDLLDSAIDAVDDKPGAGTPYEEWTKAELVERAKDLSITGPTRMSKSELIKALRAA